MRITLIAAMGANRSIGLNGGLPWRLPADLKRFKALTHGHPMIMGRKTFDSIGGAPLPGRWTVVLTRDRSWSAPGVEVAHTLDEALALAAATGDDEVFVAGGEDVFRLALDRADRIQLTRIDRDFPGDTFFPEFDESEWQVVERENHAPLGGPSDEAPFSYSFLVLDRRKD
ncbi:MAG: dihydrofolate reductase [Acidobacteriota bacterium]|jgi:dihydrofolate reductase|nr:dihydrofolate reductase [Acidobacteriota bacterium]